MKAKAKAKATSPQPLTARLEERRLVDLRPHPDQEVYFRQYNPHEFELLKADIKLNGVKVPIQVLPPGNAAGFPGLPIISGHTRARILLELGHTTANVLMRYDLIGASRADIDKLFLTDNAARRQLSMLERVRTAVRLVELELAARGRTMYRGPLGDAAAVKRVATITGKSLKSVQRYLHILAAPREVQAAFEAEQLGIVEAARVGRLKAEDRAAFAERLREGEDAKTVYRHYFPAKPGRHSKVADALDSFIRALDKSHDDLHDRIDELHPQRISRHGDKLRRGRQLIKGLLSKLDPAQP